MQETEVKTLENKEQILLNAMIKAGKPVRPGDIAKLVDLDKKEISTILKSLRKKEKIFSPKRCFYAPTK